MKFVQKIDKGNSRALSRIENENLFTEQEAEAPRTHRQHVERSVHGGFRSGRRNLENLGGRFNDSLFSHFQSIRCSRTCGAVNLSPGELLSTR